MGFAMRIGGLLLAAWWLQGCPPSPTGEEGVDSATRQLVAAAGAVRPVEGWLSAGLPYAPFGAPTARPRSSVALHRAVRRIENLAAQGSSERLLSAEALVALLAGQPNRAVDKLAQASAAAAAGAEVLGDLAAAHLAGARAEGRPEALIHALAAADRAVAADPLSIPARFNRVLALEALHLDGAAVAAWQELAETAHLPPGWEEEVEAHGAALAAPTGAQLWRRQQRLLTASATAGDRAAIQRIVAAFPQQVREHGEEELLPAWAQARERGDLAAAAEHLSIARLVGTALAAETGESMLRNAVAFIDGAEDGSSASRLRALVAGHQAFGRGLALESRQEFAAAEPWFERSRAALAEAGSPFRHWCAFHLAVCRYYRPDYAGAGEALDSLLTETAGTGPFPALAGRALWVRGLTRSAASEYAAALKLHLAALARFEGGREAEHLAFVHFLVAENLQKLGQEEPAWRHRYRALAGRRQIVNLNRLHNVLFDAGKAALRAGHPGVALYFEDEMVALARERGNPVFLAEALARRGRSRFAAGDAGGAREDLDAAWTALAEVKDARLRLRQEADLMLAEAAVETALSPRAAVISATAAIATFEAGGYRSQLPAAFLRRSQAFLALGDDDRAEADLASGLAEYEAQRRRVGDAGLRRSHFDLARDLFDAAVLFQLERRRQPARAFELTEQARARGLLDSLLSRGAPGLDGAVALAPAHSTAEAIANAIPRGVLVVELAWLEGKLATWLVWRGGMESLPLQVPQEDLAGLVAAARREVERGEASAGGFPALAALHDLLVGPWRPLLAGLGLVVFVPDGPLNDLPFAALLDRETGRFLVQEVAVMTAPGAGAFATLATAHARDAGPPAGLLAVANPAVDRDVFPDLADLPGAAREARQIAALYPQATVLAGPDATPAAFLERAAAGHEVVHFGGHALVNPEEPASSSLALAPASAGDPGALYARDLAAAAFPGVRLVILAACDTARGAASRSEGTLSLARPFLARGVPAVLASLRPVDDAAAGELLVSFHRELRAGSDPAAALAAAQRRMIESDASASPPSLSWAGFQLIGGVTPQIDP